MNNDIPEYPPETKSAIVSSASLIVRGLAISVPDGILLTRAGWARAAEIWKTIPSDDQMLLVAMIISVRGTE
jgi:hypothetical protein